MQYSPLRSFEELEMTTATLAPMHSRRLTLRVLSADDLDFVFELLSDDTTTAAMSWRVRTRKDAERWLNDRLADERNIGASVYALDNRESGRIVGLCGFIVRGARALELGYAIHASSRRQGFATEAVEVALHAARERGHRVYATIRPNNDASLRVMERVGLGFVGERRGQRGSLLVYAT